MRFNHWFWAFSLVFILLFGVACQGPIITDPGDVGESVGSLDDWPDPQPFIKEPTGEGVTSKVTLDNIVYDCTTTPYTLTNTPEEIVTFQPNASLFWVGNLLQGEGIREGLGSFASIPVEASKRAPFIVSIDLLTGNNFKRIAEPSQSAVDSAVGDLIETAENAGLVSGSRTFFESETSFESSQIALDLGLTTEYLSPVANDSLTSEGTLNENTVTAYFVEKAFTVTVDFEGKDGTKKFFDSDFTQGDFERLEGQGAIGDDNLPTYLASITYGRILMFSVTSKVSAGLLKDLIDALNKGIDGSGANALTPEQKELLESLQSTIKVVGIGGPSEANSALIGSGDLSQYFSVNAPLTSMVPISYEVRTVKGDKPAVVSRTTDYEQVECTPNTNVAPQIANLEASVNNLDVSLTADFIDPDGQVTEVTLDWGDGSPVETVYTGSSGSVSVDEQHSYPDDSDYTITLKATDNQNATNEQTVTAQPRFDLRRGLIAEFTVFERVPGERQAKDSSGQNNNGYLNTSNSTELDVATDRFGLAEQAIDFRGNDAGQSSVMEIRSSASNGALPYGDDYSMALWMFGSRFGYLIGLKEESNVFDSAGLLKKQNSGVVEFEVPLANAEAGYSLADPNPPNAEWTFYVVTIDRSGTTTSIKLYRDGTLVNEGTLDDAGPDVLPSASPILVGARANYTGGGGGLDFQGLLDDIRVYNRVLSPGEVKALYNFPQPLP